MLYIAYSDFIIHNEISFMSKDMKKVIDWIKNNWSLRKIKSQDYRMGSIEKTGINFIPNNFDDSFFYYDQKFFNFNQLYNEVIDDFMIKETYEDDERRKEIEDLINQKQIHFSVYEFVQKDLYIPFDLKRPLGEDITYYNEGKKRKITEDYFIKLNVLDQVEDLFDEGEKINVERTKINIKTENYQGKLESFLENYGYLYEIDDVDYLNFEDMWYLFREAVEADKYKSIKTGRKKPSKKIGRGRPIGRGMGRPIGGDPVMGALMGRRLIEMNFAVYVLYIIINKLFILSKNECFYLMRFQGLSRPLVVNSLLQMYIWRIQGKSREMYNVPSKSPISSEAR